MHHDGHVRDASLRTLGRDVVIHVDDELATPEAATLSPPAAGVGEVVGHLFGARHVPCRHII